jgi:DNA adenine methylase
MTPVLKWPGGKRWFVAKHAELLPKRFKRYIEPFLGSGAVFFRLQPERATLGDINPELIAVYRGIKKDWKGLRSLLCRHQRQHSDRYYYKVRDVQASSAVEKAARLIYLNRTCFNGIYRVNREGRFNVPRGTKDKVLLPTDDFEAVARLLTRAKLCVSDFEPLIDEAERGDLVFADPPYTVRHNNNAFVKYNENLFSWHDQMRLAAALIRAHSRGVHVVATNANHNSVRALYSNNGFTLTAVSRFSPISANSERRKQFEELVVLGYGKGDKE